MHCLVICKVIPAAGQILDDDFFAKKMDVVSGAVEQYSQAPINAQMRAPDNQDEALWTAELGDTGSVGVLVRRTGAISQYYIQANCTTPVLGRQFIEDLTRRSDADRAPTWKQMVDGKVSVISWADLFLSLSLSLSLRAAPKEGVGRSNIGGGGRSSSIGVTA